MKKILFLLALTLGFAATMTAQTISYPFGNVTTEALTVDASVSVSLTNQVTYMTATLDTNMTLTVVDAGIRKGAVLILEVTADASDRDLVFYTGFATTDSLTILATKTSYFQFWYDGTYMKLVGYSPLDFLQYDWISSSDSATSALVINQNYTYIDYAALDTNLTITATINNNVNKGALLFIETTADASARTVTFGTGLTSPALTNTASKTFITAFIYNGTVFKAYSQKQID